MKTTHSFAPNKKARGVGSCTLPLVEYKTLNISPTMELLRTEGDMAKVGPVEAMNRCRAHICRGHMRFYGPRFDRGLLFGKYEGKFWCPPHRRGHAEEGAVVTMYKV